MSDQPLPPKSELKNINRKNLWRLETIGDLEACEIQVYHPVLEDGSPDASRALKFCSLLDISYRGGHMKVRFDIPGTTLSEALDNFHSAGEAFGYKMLEEMESQRTRAMLTSGGTMRPELVRFQFSTFNLTGLGRLGMGDIISNIHRQMEALGHDCFWSDDGFIDDSESYVIVFEGFFDHHLEALKQIHASGSKIIIVGTEAPSEGGFNAGLTEELIVRQRTFREAVRYACAVWVTVPKAVEWYSQFGVPAAYLELGYAPGSVRKPENVLDHDFGFFGSMTPRRVNLLQKFAREKVGDRRALVRYVSFEDGDMRDLQMVRCKVILQILQHDAMQGLSTSRVCTALHIGRPVIAEHHADPGVWEGIIKFAHPDVFIHSAIRMLPHWQEIHAKQFDLFKRLLSPEKCVGRTIAETLEPFA